ncbi:MAG: hypothetical protein IJH76_05975 [Clostridia bacterium]|nr:hypothetical protein [Clostridia bacterium]
MRTYSLTLKDKIYLFFQENSIKRIAYLSPKVYEHQLNWFNEQGIRIPKDFNRYISNYVDSLIFEYDLRK